MNIVIEETVLTPILQVQELITEVVLNIDDIVTEVTLTINEEVTDVLIKVQDFAIPGEKGNEGISAYQVAVNNGFVGTETEWLLSLVPTTFDGGFFF